MAFSALLIHEGHILRRKGGKDRFGQPDTRDDDYGDNLATFPCRLVAPSGGETFTERSQDVIRAYHTLFYDVGTVDLHEDDEVRVKDPNGNVLLDHGNVTLIRNVAGLAAQHHCEAKIQIVRGSQ